MKRVLKIIDVSNWQRGEIDLSKLDKLGYDGVMMKATEGKTFKDKSLDYFYDQLHGKRDGKPDAEKVYGFYHYARPDNGNSPEEEAENFLDKVGHHTGYAMLALDWEGKALDYPIEWAIDWLDYVYKKTGVKPLLYVQGSQTPYLQKVLNRDYGLWVAHYGVKKPNTGVYPFYAMWQYTDKPVDKNYFNGDETTWTKYCKGDRNIWR